MGILQAGVLPFSLKSPALFHFSFSIVFTLSVLEKLFCPSSDDASSSSNSITEYIFVGEFINVTIDASGICVLKKQFHFISVYTWKWELELIQNGECADHLSSLERSKTIEELSVLTHSKVSFRFFNLFKGRKNDYGTK